MNADSGTEYSTIREPNSTLLCSSSLSLWLAFNRFYWRLHWTTDPVHRPKGAKWQRHLLEENLGYRDLTTSGNGGHQSRMNPSSFSKGFLLMYKYRYWQFLLYFFVTLVAFEIVLAPMPDLYAFYSSAIGYIGLSIEATLPIPQILSNYRTRSTKGFRVSVLISWIAGDMMKMFWFFTATSEIPWAFKLCGIFQACCDLFLGFQYWMYGDGPQGTVGMGLGLKDHLSPIDGLNIPHRTNGYELGRRPSNSLTENDARKFG